MTELTTQRDARPVPVVGRHLGWWMTLATFVCWGSMAAHNLYELPISPVALENTGPLVVAAILLIAHLARPASRLPVVALFGWAALNLIGGGIISVLPLPFLPFVPEQSASHYVAHVVYSLGQLPLLALTWANLTGPRGWRRA